MGKKSLCQIFTIYVFHFDDIIINVKSLTFSSTFFPFPQLSPRLSDTRLVPSLHFPKDLPTHDCPFSPLSPRSFSSELLNFLEKIQPLSAKIQPSRVIFFSVNQAFDIFVAMHWECPFKMLHPTESSLSLSLSLSLLVCNPFCIIQH